MSKPKQQKLYRSTSHCQKHSWIRGCVCIDNDKKKVARVHLQKNWVLCGNPFSMEHLLVFFFSLYISIAFSTGSNKFQNEQCSFWAWIHRRTIESNIKSCISLIIFMMRRGHKTAFLPFTLLNVFSVWGNLYNNNNDYNYWHWIPALP